MIIYNFIDIYLSCLYIVLFIEFTEKLIIKINKIMKPDYIIYTIMEMFTTTYRPKKLDDFIGNKDVILPFIRWLLNWTPEDKKNKCALVSGLCGIGKNLLVDLILYKHYYNTVHIALDEDRDKDYMTNVIKPLLKTKRTFDGKRNALVFSDIDAGCDHGFMANLVDCIKETEIPIICICNDRYDQSIKPVLNYCYDIKMSKPTYQEVYHLLYKVVTTEKIKVKEQQLKDLYEQSKGDIRFMLNSLQYGLLNGTKNIQSTNIFETTAKLLSMDEDIEEKYKSYWLSNDLHPLMIQENYVNNIMGGNDLLKRLSNIAYSADALSDVDMFQTCVNMTNWELEPYVALSVINSALKCNKKAMIKFPQYLGKIATINKNRREKLKPALEACGEDKQKPSENTVKKSRGRPKKSVK